MALALDGSAKNTFSTAASGTVTLTTSANSGVAIVAYFGEKSGSLQTITGISGGGLSWAKRTQYTLSTDAGSDLEVWWAKYNAPLSGVTITITLSGAIDNAALVAFGVSGATGFDTNASLPAKNSATSSNGNVTGSTSGAAFLFSVWGSPAGGTATPGVESTLIQEAQNSGGSRFAYEIVEYINEATAVSNTQQTVSHASEAWGMVMDALSAGGGNNVTTSSELHSWRVIAYNAKNVQHLRTVNIVTSLAADVNHAIKQYLQLTAAQATVQQNRTVMAAPSANTPGIPTIYIAGYTAPN